MQLVIFEKKTQTGILLYMFVYLVPQYTLCEQWVYSNFYQSLKAYQGTSNTDTPASLRAPLLYCETYLIADNQISPAILYMYQLHVLEIM